MLPARRHEISRLEAFSDAVFAFALALLVVSLDVPSSYAELMKLMAGFVPFAASFALLTRIWYEHSIFFRKYGLQDARATTVNAVLLFVVLFYVYPLTFPFTAAFSFFMPVLGIRRQSSPDQIANIFAIYGAGFIVLFGMFALLYRHAHTKRDELRLDALELFDLRASGGAHGVSMAVGARATGVGAIAPPQLAVFSGFIYFLMGPAHWVYVGVQRRRLALEARLVDTPSEAEA